MGLEAGGSTCACSIRFNNCNFHLARRKQSDKSKLSNNLQNNWTVQKGWGAGPIETKTCNNQTQCTLKESWTRSADGTMKDTWDSWGNVSENYKLQDIIELMLIFLRQMLISRKGIWVFIILFFKLLPRLDTSKHL